MVSMPFFLFPLILYINVTFTDLLNLNSCYVIIQSTEYLVIYDLYIY
jgi:hypothetical protein